MDAPAGMSPRRRRTWRIVGWILGSLAAVATVWLAYLLITIIVEWPTYVGHESSTATAILIFIGVIPAAIAWTLALIPVIALKYDRGGRADTDG